MKIAICDDEVLQLELLNHYVERWANEEDINYSVELFQSAESFHFQWLEDSSYDVILLDIEMGELDGMQLSKLIREKDNRIQIIFITALTDYIHEGYDVDAINYLIKPISEEKLKESLNKAIGRRETNSKSIFIESSGVIYRADEDSIMYMEIKDHQLYIYKKNKVITTRKTLKEMEETLSKDEFIKPHRSYMVGIKYIKKIDSKQITLKDNSLIPISRGNYGEVQKRFFDYFKRDIK